MKKKILITSALPYVNNIPHLGNIIGCVLSADVFAKYCKISEYDYLYICGTDEYGTTTETKALQESLSPKQLCDNYHKIHKEIYDWFDIEFSYFGRTSSDKQTEIVQDIFWKLYNNGYILEDILTQPYCEKCSMFLADRFVEGICPACGYEYAKGDQCENCGKLLDPQDLKDPKCSICKERPIFKETKHLFLDLESLKPQLEKWIDETAYKYDWSNNAISITKAWLEQGLKKRCITRDLKWGVPVPLKGYENKVFYVWFDAPIGYISITASKYDDWESWWKNPEQVLLYQFMGKDNIPFHTVIFPSSLIGTKENWTLLNKISSTEYLNYEDLKFSKSRGTGIFGDQAKDTGIDSDLYRYYLLRNRPEKNDTQFLWNDFLEKVNGEIIANYANLVNRTFQFIEKFFNLQIPRFNYNNSIFASVDYKNEINKIIDLYEKLEIKNCILAILELCSTGNKFFQDNKPWDLIKTNKQLCSDIIGSLVCFIKDISILLYPYIPKGTKKVFDILNIDINEMKLKNISNYNSILNKTIKKPEILYKKLEKEQIEILKEKFSGKNNSIQNDTINNFSRICIKVGKIIEIKRHPGAEKLYIEKIDLGNGDIRQIISGLVPYYKEEELLNKNVLVVSNLKKAVIRGEESYGMLLAAETKDKKDPIEVIFPEDQIGTIVTLENEKKQSNTYPEISIDDFFKIPIEVVDNKLKYGNFYLLLNGKNIETKIIKNGKVK